MNGAKRQARGMSLLEAMMASAILIVGLTGVTLMLTRGAVNARNGQQMIDSSQIITAKLAELHSAGLDSLTITSGSPSFDGGSFDDGGFYTDGSGRVYMVTQIVTDATPPMPPAW